MAISTAQLMISQKAKGKFFVEIDRYRFERLIDSLGLFNRDFLDSIDQAEDDIRQGRVKKLRSLRQLRT